MIKVGLTTFAILSCSALPDSRVFASIEITVDAGRHERRNVPVRVQPPPGEIGDAKVESVTLTSQGGDAIPAQWTRPSLTSGDGGEIHFVLPHLAAGESVRLKATLSP